MSRKNPGQWFFSAMSHTLYDAFVYKLVTPFIWRCSTRTLLDSYHRNLSGKHLEIGVGTGYLLKQSEPHSHDFALSLMDLNNRCLRKSARRLRNYRPKLHHHSVTKPMDFDSESFDSIGVNFVFHCVARDFMHKGCAFHYINSVLSDGGVCYGATVLNHGVTHTKAARMLLFVLNALSIFRNREDSVEGLRAALENTFDQVEINTVGSVALWTAKKR